MLKWRSPERARRYPQTPFLLTGGVERPQILPTLGIVTHAKGDCICLISLDSTGGTSLHAVCVVDERGAVALQMEVAHDEAALAEMRRRLAKLAPAGDIPVAIERPSGLIVDALIDAGHPVVPIHPNVVKACRPRYRAAGGKSDAGDAFMLADILRTDGHRFRPLAPCSDEIKALRALVRGRDGLVAERVCLANRLRSLLDSFWAGAGAIFADIDSPIALAFLQRYPTPKSAARLGEKRLAAFLAANEMS